MKHIMVDIETLSTEADAVILSIGAVYFNPHGTVGDLGSKFYCAIDLQGSINLGRSISASTLKWWLQQAPEAQAAAFGGTTPLSQALDNFSDFVHAVGDVCGDECHDVCVWGHGPSFDNAILKDAYRVFGSSVPWGFRNDRCNRTFLALAEDQGVRPDLVRAGTFHNALDDAITQATHMQKVNEELRANAWKAAA